ncbi:aminopeptidase [Lacticaseibacillus rhamnosus]|uniref:aminopeptidase n=1 Tax=Lacticaseibacillus rhamnosus TaxID=47715 RepID=UPI0021A58B1D|nr:aminopeptidase [Lacticaseibacillus rhamnosus]MCT3169286.1 aminopeptidase [Lacticaseibacillus rhamnosus]MCT3177843.1 aminopeptidase [Lacticaseibacillus rhamnosus]MCT3185344.1 aminopeptidase [Lacticaseibacillus rhamnosus]MCT4450081.1 aminopeptidase [Lacticaseibacillus rhamnosus]
MTLSNFNESLKKYAELAVDIGVAVKPGDTVYVQISVDQAQLAHLIVAAAYQRGAAEVQVQWFDDVLKRLDMAHMADERLFNIPAFVKGQFDYWVDHQAKRITVVSSDPDNLAGIDSNRIAKYQEAFAKAYKRLMEAISSMSISWTIIGAASPRWAQKVFPDAATSEEATELLWEAIFKTTRIDQPDPEAAWKAHDQKLREKAAWLNNEQFDQLHYMAPGTDLVVGLPKNHIWEGAGAFNPRGEEFMANMPTEEVFTAPDFRRIDGTVASTKPLSYGGNILEDMHFTFKDGQIVEAHAKQGDDVLQNLLKTPGARSLGEVSLVPDPSPISQSGLIFFNTLFDENASDHMALGQAYPFSVKDGVAMTNEQRAAAGLNQSPTHVDFMMGSAAMNIDGIKPDGTIIPIFRNGDWT